MSEVEQTVACSLPEEQREARKKQLRESFVQRIQEARELPDGLALRYPGGEDVRAELHDFIEFERGCCGFARFELREEPAQESVWLEIRGRAGTREFWSQLVPEGMPIGPVTAGDRTLRRGLSGLGAALLALLLCSIPEFALLLGFIGLGGATSGVLAGIDGLAVAGVIVSVGVVIWALLRRRNRPLRVSGP